MTSELGTTTTTTRVSTTAAAAKMKTMSMTVTTTMSRVLPLQVHASDPHGGDIIHVDEVSCLFFSLNIVSNHISRRTTGRALNRRMGTPQGAIILPYKIHQADVPGIHDTGIETLGHLRRSGARVPRAIAQRDPWLAKLLKTPTQVVVVPQQGSCGVVCWTGEHLAPGRGLKGTVGTCAAKSEPLEDRNILPA